MLSVVLLWRLFGRVAPVVAFAVVFDYYGFLAWTVNTYRVWAFVLYFGMALAVLRSRPRWLALLTFLVFQIEYGMALYMVVTMVTLAVLVPGRRGWRLILAAGVGGLISLAIFSLQVFAYYGRDGFVAELGATYLRRGTGGEAATVGTYLYQAVDGVSVLLLTIGQVSHNWVVAIMTLVAMVWAPWMLARGHLSGTRRLVALLLVSTSVGTMVAAPCSTTSSSWRTVSRRFRWPCSYRACGWLLRA